MENNIDLECGNAHLAQTAYVALYALLTLALIILLLTSTRSCIDMRKYSSSCSILYAIYIVLAVLLVLVHVVFNMAVSYWATEVGYI